MKLIFLSKLSTFIKYAFIVVLVTSLFSCSNDTTETTNSNDEKSAELVSYDRTLISLKEYGDPSVSEDAKKYYGEFANPKLEGHKIIIRNHPTKEGFLAKNLYLDNNSKGMANFWYNKYSGRLSNRYDKDQLTFTTIQLNESGDLLLEITQDLAQMTSDTTNFHRIK